MKNLSKILLLTSIAFTFISAARISDHQYMAAAPLSVNTGTPDSISVNTLVNISRKDFEKKIGRKLGLFERMALKKVKKKLKKEPGWVFDDRKIAAEAIISPIAGMAGLLSLGAGFVSALGQIDCEENCSNGAVFFLIFSFAATVTALIAGILGLKKIKAKPEKWKGRFLAWLGIFLSALFLFFILLLIFI